MNALRCVCFLLFISFAKSDESQIYCYQCNSWVDQDCVNIQPNNTNSIYYKPCKVPENINDFVSRYDLFCRKIIQIIPERENLVRVIRKCGWIKQSKHDCYKVVNDDHSETVCQCFQDGCNNALRLTSSNIIFICILSYLGFLFTH